MAIEWWLLFFCKGQHNIAKNAHSHMFNCMCRHFQPTVVMTWLILSVHNIGVLWINTKINRVGFWHEGYQKGQPLFVRQESRSIYKKGEPSSVVWVSELTNFCRWLLINSVKLRSSYQPQSATPAVAQLLQRLLTQFSQMVTNKLLELL